MNEPKFTEKHRDVARYIGILIYEGDYDEDISDYLKEESAGIIAQHFPEPPEERIEIFDMNIKELESKEDSLPSSDYEDYISKLFIQKEARISELKKELIKFYRIAENAQTSYEDEVEKNALLRYDLRKLQEQNERLRDRLKSLEFDDSGMFCQWPSSESVKEALSEYPAGPGSME